MKKILTFILLIFATNNYGMLQETHSYENLNSIAHNDSIIYIHLDKESSGPTSPRPNTVNNNSQPNILCHQNSCNVVLKECKKNPLVIGCSLVSIAGCLFCCAVLSVLVCIKI